jgi:hypothetical protein
VPPKQTPEWDDPTLTSYETTQASDVYKLALAAYRAVWIASSDRPPADRGATPLPDGIPPELAQFIGSSVAPAGRPTAHDWMDGLNAVLPLLRSTGSPDAPSSGAGGRATRGTGYAPDPPVRSNISVVPGPKSPSRNYTCVIRRHFVNPEDGVEGVRSQSVTVSRRTTQGPGGNGLVDASQVRVHPRGRRGPDDDR